LQHIENQAEGIYIFGFKCATKFNQKKWLGNEI